MPKNTLGNCFGQEITTHTEIRAQLLLDLICALPLDDSQMVDELAWLNRWAREGKITPGDAYLSRKIGLAMYHLYRWAPRIDPVPRIVFTLNEFMENNHKGPARTILIRPEGLEERIRKTVQSEVVLYFDPEKRFVQDFQDHYVPDETTVILTTAAMLARNQYLRINPEARFIAGREEIEKVIDPHFWVIAKEIINVREKMAKDKDEAVDTDIDERLFSLRLASLCQNRLSAAQLASTATLSLQNLIMD